MAADPVKISLLTRPVSSHEDPAAGFSFTKAKPMQPLDFSRKISSNAILPVPFPNVVNRLPQESRQSILDTAEEQHKEQAEPAVAASNEAMMSGDDTLVEPESEKVDALSRRHGSNSGPQKPVRHPTQSRQTSVDVTSQHPKEQTPTTRPVGRIAKLPEAGVDARLKGTKPQKMKQGPLGTSARAFEPLSQKALCNEADFLQMLLHKRRQDDQEREKERKAMQKALQDKETEYQDLYAASEDLYAQLQDMSQRYRASEANLSKIKEAKPGWEIKLKKLSDFIKGLTHDHNRLRDDAREMSERQYTILEEKESIVKALREVCQTSEERHSSSRQQITEARHDMEVLSHDMDHQQVQLRQVESLLSFERAKNDHLEKQISTLTDSHALLASLITEHRDAISRGITQLLEKYQQGQLASVSNPEDSLKPILEQCFMMLKELPNAGDHVRSADLQNFNDSMRQHLDIINTSIKKCEHTAAATKDQQQQLVVSLKEDFQSLGRDITTEQALSEKIMDLREIKATVREQLQSTNKDLQEARLEAIQLRSQVSEQSNKIIRLENETKIQQPSEDPKLLLRIQELDAIGRDLQRDMHDRTAEKEDLFARLQQKEETLERLQNESSLTQTQLEQARQQVEAIQQEKSECKRQAILEREELRKRLSRAADQELQDLKSKHLNEIQQLKLKHASADNRQEETTLQPRDAEQDLSDLFPTTPKGGSQELEVSHLTYSSSRITSRNGTITPRQERRPSRDILPHPGSHASIPKGILKAPRPKGEKRTATEMEKTDTAGFTAPKKRKSNMTTDLGPVVPESQSPAKAISGRSRKQTAAKKGRKDDKWQRTFNEYAKTNQATNQDI